MPPASSTLPGAPRRRASLRRWALAWSALATLAAADAGAFTLGTEGCPMAHCDARMSDLVNSVGPTAGTLVRADRSAPPAFGGLGCVSNSRLVACSGGGDPTATSNLVVYDADGNRLWQDGGRLGASAWKSAPIIGVDDRVIAADQNTVLMADPRTGTVLWQTAKPDVASPISPVLAGAAQDLVLLASGAGGAVTTPLVSIFDTATGALLHSVALVDPVTQAVYATFNTPAVAGNRAYVLASAMGTETRGRLYALDICNASACGGRGKLSIAWTYDFRGPSNASPLLIGNRLYFDGRTSTGTGTFMAVEDTGSAPSLVWQVAFNSTFAASAAQDPRGGFWIYPWQTGKLLRVNPKNGTLLQTVDVSTVLGAGAGYYPVTAVSTSTTAAGAVVLTFGARAAGQTTATPPYVLAVNVSSAAAGTRVWRYRLASSSAVNVPTGQFPVVVNAAGARRVVARGATGSTFFIGQP